MQQKICLLLCLVALAGVALGKKEGRCSDPKKCKNPCQQLPCNQELETCEVFTRVGKKDIVKCIPINIDDRATCEDLKCTDTCVVLTNDNAEFAFCPQQNNRSQNRTEEERPDKDKNGGRQERPGHPRNGTKGEKPDRPGRPRNGTKGEKPDRPCRPRNGTKGGRRTRKPESCEDLECNETRTCEVFTKPNGKTVAKCVPIDNLPTCDDLKCEQSNKTCCVLSNEKIEFAFCIQRGGRLNGEPTDIPTREKPIDLSRRTRPTGLPTRGKPTGRPTRPADRPTRPAGRPTKPTGLPTREQPADLPRRTRPTGLPTRGMPTGRPTRPADRPTRPAGRPTRPAGRPSVNNRFGRGQRG